jgi:hypothetical protein
MLQFILTSILMIAMGTVLYLLVRAMPRIGEQESSIKSGIVARWMASEIPEKIDYALNNFLLKFLRKLKVSILKFDNVVTKKLHNIKSENENGKPKIDFRDITGDKVVKDDKPDNNNS